MEDPRGSLLYPLWYPPHQVLVTAAGDKSAKRLAICQAYNVCLFF